ncbi:MAG: tRNA (adenosine(37)-N6)-dimethylallyltransferase MiaA [Campylobacterales bacterium]|nr:tRNA (adenosine(37)-N6)-dimethylallyltransferase MiaA [Campylobacterales bacterium]
MDKLTQIALIGPTASGKTALSIKIAKKLNAHILSLDSLSIYKEIDIVSAKPTVEEREGIHHFGMDHLSPNENFDVTTFIRLYHQSYEQALEEGKNLVIVGGTSFYLKMLIDGISALPTMSKKTLAKTDEKLRTLEETYRWLYSLDPDYMSQIASSDTYRIEKALHIFFETSMIPSKYFKAFPPTPTIAGMLPIYQIMIDKAILRERITLRTKQMIQNGLIDEICMLERKYTRAPNCMKAIGIKETLAYLDGIYDKKMLEEKIITHTARLAKRQTTFNQSQFENVIKGSIAELEKNLIG